MAYGVVSSMNLCYATTRLRDVVPTTQIHQPTTYIKDVVNSFTPPAAMPSHGTMGVRRAQLPVGDGRRERIQSSGDLAAARRNHNEQSSSTKAGSKPAPKTAFAKMLHDKTYP